MNRVTHRNGGTTRRPNSGVTTATSLDILPEILFVQPRVKIATSAAQKGIFRRVVGRSDREKSARRKAERIRLRMTSERQRTMNMRL